MAKKKSDDSRASFIPSEVEVPTRTFIPEAPTLPPPTVVEMQGSTMGGEFEGMTLTMERTGSRDIKVSLAIPPLAPCVQTRINMPTKLSRETFASIVASLIRLAATEAEADGIAQNYNKNKEELEAKDRYGRR